MLYVLSQDRGNERITVFNEINIIMALIKCKECGHEVSDKASACPNCGCPIEKNLLCDECGQAIPEGVNECPNCGCPIQNSNEEVISISTTKTNKWQWFAAMITALLVCGVGIFYFLEKEKNTIAEKKEKAETAIEDSSTSYQIILYEDGSGEFNAPDGKRICGIGHTSGRVEKMNIFLTEEIKLMGIRTQSLDLIEGRLYASYGDYMEYKTGRQKENATKGKNVTVKEENDKTVISFDLDDREINAPNIVKADLSNFNKDQYCIVIYPDKEGTLYGPGKSRICGLKKDFYETTEYEVTFKKEVELYGKETKKLAVDKGNVYLKAMDVVYERSGEASRRVGTANVSKQNGVTIISFSGKVDPKLNVQSKEAVPTQKTEKDAIKDKGWAFVYNRLKSPSTARLVGYVDPKEDESVKFANAINLPGLSVATYQVDAQNSFGAMIRQIFIVFFKNGRPMHMEEASSLKGDANLLRATLRINGYDDI